MHITTVGIDVGKNWFHVVTCNATGRVLQREKLNRTQLGGFAAHLAPSLVGMECCAGAQYWARRFEQHGHQVRLMAPKFIKAYLKSQKNDFNDAEAIAEAVTRPTMRFVPVKSGEQLELQALHRVRQRLVGERTALINQIRGFLLETGVTVPRGRARLRQAVPMLLEDAGNELSVRLRALLTQLLQDWDGLGERIARYSAEIECEARQREPCQRLITVPGIGALGATALVAAIGNGATFRRGRDLAAWLGLVPRQYSTGGKPRLGGIGKRGNSYLRQLLIHGARSCLLHLQRSQHRMGAWLSQLEARVHHNVAVVALANKLARIAWAVLVRGESYRAQAAGVR
jgi:transposase